MNCPPPPPKKQRQLAHRLVCNHNHALKGIDKVQPGTATLKTIVCLLIAVTSF